MDETYRMLGREHELDLAREARNRSLAALLVKPEGVRAPAEPTRRRANRFLARPLRTRPAG